MKIYSASFLLLVSVAAANAQFNFNRKPQINVSGSAEVRVAPNEILLHLAVETRSQTLNPGRVENDADVAAALAFLKRAGVPDKDVKTDFISVQPNYDDDRSRVKPADYIIQKSIEVCLTNVASFQGVLTGLLTNGVNVVQGIDFRTTQLRKYRDQARKMAIDAAKEKAQALTQELGVKLGRPNTITVYENNGWYGWNQNPYQNAIQNVAPAEAATASDETSGTFAAGRIRVTATVNVSFLLK